jgi:hypothetical protein
MDKSRFLLWAASYRRWVWTHSSKKGRQMARTNWTRHDKYQAERTRIPSYRVLSRVPARHTTVWVRVHGTYQYVAGISNDATLSRPHGQSCSIAFTPLYRTVSSARPELRRAAAGTIEHARQTVSYVQQRQPARDSSFFRCRRHAADARMQALPHDHTGDSSPLHPVVHAGTSRSPPRCCSLNLHETLSVLRSVSRVRDVMGLSE